MEITKLNSTLYNSCDQNCNSKDVNLENLMLTIIYFDNVIKEN